MRKCASYDTQGSFVSLIDNQGLSDSVIYHQADSFGEIDTLHAKNSNLNIEI